MPSDIGTVTRTMENIDEVTNLNNDQNISAKSGFDTL